MWSEGTIGIPDAKDKTKYTVCRYWVKHYDEPSEVYGLNKGKISKLEIRIDDIKVASYDRGWDLEPTCKEAELALCILLNNYN
jgi:hypothetical protein